MYTSNRRAGLTCPERDGGEKEIAYWETGDGRETVWDICIIHKWVDRNRTCLYDNVLPQKPHDDVNIYASRNDTQFLTVIRPKLDFVTILSLLKALSTLFEHCY